MNGTQKIKIFFDPNCQQCLCEMNAIKRTDNYAEIEFIEIFYEKSRINLLIDSLKISYPPWAKALIHDKRCGHSSIR